MCVCVCVSESLPPLGTLGAYLGKDKKIYTFIIGGLTVVATSLGDNPRFASPPLCLNQPEAPDKKITLLSVHHTAPRDHDGAFKRIEPATF